MTTSLKPSPPQTPNAGALNAAQTANDVGTATANTWMQNANINTPMGSVNYQEGANKNIAVPVFGPDGSFQGMQNFAIPTFTRNETLAPAQQQMLNQQNQLGINLNNVALNQTSKIGDILNAPVSGANLPARTDSYGTQPTFQSVGQGPALARAGSEIGPAASITHYNQFVGNAVPYAPDVGSAERSLGDAGSIQRSIGPTDYATQRADVENAIYSRLNPQLDRDRNALETKLVNQGLARGSGAFNTAMDESNRQATDARMQAVLAGGQEQSRLAGLDLQKGQFANTAEQQAYDQILSRGEFKNQGQAQDYAQTMGRTNLYNATQAQNFQQAAANGAFANAAQAQEFDQAQQRGLFGLQAADQNNNAAMQEYQNQASAVEANNQIAQQQYGNTQSAAQFGNENRDKALQEMLALRNQPINEISALMAGGQVNLPQFQQYNPGTIANNNLGQNMYSSAALGMDAYKTKQATTNALIGALGGVAGAGLYGLGKRA